MYENGSCVLLPSINFSRQCGKEIEKPFQNKLICLKLGFAHKTFKQDHKKLQMNVNIDPKKQTNKQTTKKQKQIKLSDLTVTEVKFNC